MAIASVGTLGSVASSTSATSLAFVTATNALSSGDFAILTVHAANLGAADGNNGEHTSVTGGTGKWKKLGEYTKSGGSAGAGVTSSTWLFEASGTNAIGTTFTINFSAAIVDKVALGQKFTKGAGLKLRWSPAASQQYQTVSAANGFGSSAFSALASTSRLSFRALGKKANSTTAITPTTNFTAGAAGTVRSRNNSAAVLGASEFRINASTGETSNPTLAVSGNASSVFVALEEYDPATVTCWDWDTSHVDWLLSNGNLTANRATGGANNALLFSTKTRSDGGFWEGNLDAIGTGTFGVGFSPGGGALPGNNDYLHDTGVGYLSDNRVDYANTVIYNGSTYTTADKIQGYLSNAQKAWFGKSATYQNSGNNAPNSGLGGVDVSATATSWVAAAFANNVGGQITANFGASAFSTSIPTGSQSWDGSQTSGTTYNDPLTESATAADSLANAETFGPGLTESAAPAASLDPAGSTFGVPLGESAAAGDGFVSTANFASTLAESSSAADSATGGLLQSASLNEAATPADAASVAVTFGPSLSETAAAGDTLASQAVFASPLGESAAAAASPASSAVFASPLSESSAANDNLTSAAVMPTSLGESISAGTSFSAGAATYNEGLSESLAAGATAAAALGIGLSLAETAAAASAQSATAGFGSALGETAGAGDSVAAAASFAAGLTEATAANDAIDGALQSSFPPGAPNAARIGRVARAGRIGSIGAEGRIGKVQRAGRVG